MRAVLEMTLKAHAKGRALNKRIADEKVVLHEIFAGLDKGKKEHLIVDDFRTFLKANGMLASERELKLLVARYDRKNNKRITLVEFADQLTF